MQTLTHTGNVVVPESNANFKTDRVQRLAMLGNGQFTVRIARPDERPAIDALRTVAYANASNFKLPEPDRVLTRHDPDNSFCFVISDGQQIAATMRVVFIGSRAEGARVVEGSVPEDACTFPGVALCRGATAKNFRGMGLMTFLVSTGVAVAYRAGLRSAIAVQAVGTAHFDAMLQAGWQSEEVSGKQVRLVALNGPELKFVYLPISLLPRSQQHSEQRHHDLWQYLQADQAIAAGVRQMPTGMQRQLKASMM